MEKAEDKPTAKDWVELSVAVVCIVCVIIKVII